MQKKQLLGLGLIVICGGLSQWTPAKENQLVVWLMALGAMAGMLLVLSEYFTSKKES